MAPGGMAGLLCVTLLAVMVNVAQGANGTFSSLQKSLIVSAQVQNVDNHAGDSQAGEDHIAIQWSLNSTFAGQDSGYNNVITYLCFGPPSQVNKGWRKTANDLSVDKTCTGATIAHQRYTPTGNSTVWLISREVPKGVYFVRAYAVDTNGMQLAYGQTTNKNKTTSLIFVNPISGRTTSMDIASAVFSVFAVAAFFGYLGLETLLAKRKQRLSGGK